MNAILARAVFGLALVWSSAVVVIAAEVVRSYPITPQLSRDVEENPGVVGAKVGLIRNENPLGRSTDLLSFAGVEPMFVEGRQGPGSLAVAFHGTTEEPDAAVRLTGSSFCTFCSDLDVRIVLLEHSDGTVGQTVDRAVQLWMRVDELPGREQVVMVDGSGPWSGIGITADGNWAHLWSSQYGLSITDTGAPVEPGRWTHIAMNTARSGNAFYVDGRVVHAEAWLTGRRSALQMVLGANRVLPNQAAYPFIGAIDELKFMVSDEAIGGFDPRFDLDFWAETHFSGVFGDVNQDGKVSADDLYLWLANRDFNNRIGVGDPYTLLRGDVDQNGTVDVDDLWLIVAALPEPGTMALLGVGCGVGWRRPRK